MNYSDDIAIKTPRCGVVAAAVNNFGNSSLSPRSSWLERKSNQIVKSLLLRATATERATHL